MTLATNSSYLKETIELLIYHFGEDAVLAALADVSTHPLKKRVKPLRKSNNKNQKPTTQTIAGALESIREQNPEKHRLLSEFLSDLAARRTLPQAEDIRYFAQGAGLKAIEGKSRKDLIPNLMRFLLTLSTDRVRSEIQKAAHISEEQRRQGFSILTDKLLGKQTGTVFGDQNERKTTGSE
jgi:hypothetical protein